MIAKGVEDQRLALAKRIRDSREYLNLSQDDVATALNLTRPAVTNIENGSRKVESLELEQLSRLFGCTVDYLLGVEDVRSTKAFLARTLHGLTEADLDEVARFAEFLRMSSKQDGRKSRGKK